MPSPSTSDGVGRSAAAAVVTRHVYGSDPSQFGDLYRPSGTPRPGTVVLVHGGFWRFRYSLTSTAPLAADLAARGHVVWNLEYRRVGLNGGWPETLDDVGVGIDLLDTLGVDTDRVVTIGHSAGGHLAVWAAGRRGLPAGSPGGRPRVDLTAAVSMGGVVDLATASRVGVGETVVDDFLGGPPEEVPARYAVADPMAHLPLPVPVLCMHSKADVNVPFAQSTAYVAAAVAAGADATLVRTTGDHFTLVDPASADWATLLAALPGLLGESDGVSRSIS